MYSFNYSCGGKPGSDRPAAVSQSKLSAFSSRFSADKRGSLAIVFALMLTMVVTIVGGAVDYSRWLAAKTTTISAMDTAVLAGGRALLIGQSSDAAIEIAEKYYAENKSPVLSLDNVTFTVVNQNEVVAVSDSAVATSILGVAGIDELRVRGEARAKVEVGANAGSHVEIALMLDTTGSMSGSKIGDLKTAAKDLINITVWSDQSEYTSRVALVPFADQVNVGRDYFQAFTNQAPSGSGNSKTCVRERLGSKRYKDAKPKDSNGYFEPYDDWGSCRTSAVLTWLTSDKSALFSAIDNLPATGWTAGHLGTQWTWYALSQRFRSFLPQANKPNRYNMLTQYNDQGQPKLRKIAVLMTDGAYNTRYNHGDTNDSSAQQAREICENMKDKGIEVYAVGFEIPNGSEEDTTMELCASSPDHYYLAEDGDALRSAFRDIALKIATLRLIH